MASNILVQIVQGKSGHLEIKDSGARIDPPIPVSSPIDLTISAGVNPNSVDLLELVRERRNTFYAEANAFFEMSRSQVKPPYRRATIVYVQFYKFRLASTSSGADIPVLI